MSASQVFQRTGTIVESWAGVSITATPAQISGCPNGQNVLLSAIGVIPSYFRRFLNLVNTGSVEIILYEDAAGTIEIGRVDPASSNNPTIIEGNASVPIWAATASSSSTLTGTGWN